MDITGMLNSKAPSSAIESSTAQSNLNIPISLQNGTGYPSPAEPSPAMSALSNGFEEPPYDNLYMQKNPSTGSSSQHSDTVRGSDSAVKPASASSEHGRTFPCATCGKGFARRSDLARHERIHSGDRPHVCQEPGCGKPFIQRSALTVHMRVHSGEKPHMCERCGKPFSDSSSLARHRRIHSGKRPYQCPFADCQKTFTRRTTLTRHQNHHSGTVEEAAVARQRALASRGPHHQRSGSTGTVHSDSASQMSSMSIGTASPRSERNFSLSPSQDVRSIPSLHRQSSSISYGSSESLPPHLRAGLQQPSPRSSPSASSPSLSAFGGSGGSNALGFSAPATSAGYHHRPSLTSHPILPVLEPPTYHEMRSTSGSPHLSAIGSGSGSGGGAGSSSGGAPGPPGWQSPIHPISMPSPSLSNYSMYPDPPNMPLYLAHSHLRRPQSTEPDQYEMKPRGSTSAAPAAAAGVTSGGSGSAGGATSRSWS